MKKRAKGEIIIRRIREKDLENTNCDLMTFVKMSFDRIHYVAVVRGTNMILECGNSKREVKEALAWEGITNKEYNNLNRARKKYYHDVIAKL